MKRIEIKPFLVRIIVFAVLLPVLTGCGNNIPVTDNKEQNTVSENTNIEDVRSDAEQILSVLHAWMDGTLEEETAAEDNAADMNETTALKKEDIKALYKAFFLNKHETEDKVCLADVTHDGIDEMIVVHRMENQDIEGYVYTVKDGQVSKIYEKRGAEVHAGGFFTWYLVDKGDHWNLAEEDFSMWQGMGSVGYTEYYLSEDGDMIDVFSIGCPEDDNDVDDEGYVKSDAFSRYTTKLNELTNVYELYAVTTEGVNAKSKVTDYRGVFEADEYEGKRKLITDLNDNDREVLSTFASNIWKTSYDMGNTMNAGKYAWYDMDECDAYMFACLLTMSDPDLFEREDEYGAEMIKIEDLAGLLADGIGASRQSMTEFLADREETRNGYVYLYGGDWGEVSPWLYVHDIYIDDNDYITVSGELGETGCIFEEDIDIDVNNMVPFSMKFGYMGEGGIKGFRYYEMELMEDFTSVFVGY